MRSILNRDQADDIGRYRSVGKHRFGALLIASLILYGAIQWLLSRLLDEATSRHITWLVISLIWIARQADIVLRPGRYQDETDTCSSLPKPPVHAVVGLIIFTAITTVVIIQLFRHF